MSTDTMYINSSRVLPSRSKNKQPNSMFPRSNSNKSITSNNSNGGNKSSKKRGPRKNDGVSQNQKSPLKPADIPQNQSLPNGERPNFGNSSSTTDKRRSSGNKKDNLAGNHAKNVTADLKNLLLDNKNNKPKSNKNTSAKRGNDKSPRAGSNTHTNKKQEVINVNMMKKESTTPIMTFLTSPINAPGSIPNMNLSETRAGTPGSQRSSGTPGMLPGVTPNVLAGPGLNMPPQFVGHPQQQQMQPMMGGNMLPMSQPQFQPHYVQQMGPQPPYGMPVGQQLPPPNQRVGPPAPPAILQGQPMQGLGYPFGMQNNYNLSSMPVPLPQQIPLIVPMGHGQNGLPNNAKAPVSQMPKTTQNTPVSTPTALLSNQVSPKVQNNRSKSSAKKSKDRTSSHSFAGASFATDVPQESNLPKPSFL